MRCSKARAYVGRGKVMRSFYVLNRALRERRKSVIFIDPKLEIIDHTCDYIEETYDDEEETKPT